MPPVAPSSAKQSAPANSRPLPDIGKQLNAITARVTRMERKMRTNQQHEINDLVHALRRVNISSNRPPPRSTFRGWGPKKHTRFGNFKQNQQGIVSGIKTSFYGRNRSPPPHNNWRRFHSRSAKNRLNYEQPYSRKNNRSRSVTPHPRAIKQSKNRARGAAAHAPPVPLHSIGDTRMMQLVPSGSCY